MKNYTKDLLNLKEISRTLGAVIGALIFAAGLNLFIVPVGVYTGGIMGICQLIRSILTQYLHFNFGAYDFAGIIYYLANVPLFFLAYKTMGKLFFIKTMICMASMTIFLTIIPIPSHLLITDDILTSCLIGGIISGAGCGFTLMMGGSSGGLDIVGIYFIKYKGNYSVGKVSMFTNFFLYIICLILFDISIVIYSIIVAAVTSIAMDKIHAQNINVEVIIITRKDLSLLQSEVMNQMGRGITKWNTTGAYTQEGSEILYIILSKYEVHQLKRMVNKYDPDAFFVIKEGVSVDGNYTKKL